MRLGNIHVTNNALNMKVTMKRQSWLGSAGHIINLILSHSLKFKHKQHTTEEEPNEVQKCDLTTKVIQLIDLWKWVVSHVKRSNIQPKQDTKLKQWRSVRWNSILIMLHYIVHKTDKSRMLNTSSVTESCKGPWLMSTLICLKRYLSFWYTSAATWMFSTDLTPSLHLVYPVKVHVKKNFQATAVDRPSIGKLKYLLTKKVDVMYPVKLFHRMSTLLDPRLRCVYSAPKKILMQLHFWELWWMKHTKLQSLYWLKKHQNH